MKLISSVILISTNRIKVLRLWLTCFEDWPIRILTFAWWMLKTRNTMVSWQAFPSLPPRAPLTFLLRLKLPFPSLSTPATQANSPPVPPNERRRTRVSYEQNDFPVCCRNKQRNFKNNQTSCSQNTRRRWRNLVWKFLQVKLSLFDLNFIDETDEKVFCLQMQIKSCVTLFSWRVHNYSLFLQNILNKKRIYISFWRNLPARAKQMPSKVLFLGKKLRRLFGHCAPKL